jgi:hypothetical protein
MRSSSSLHIIMIMNNNHNNNNNGVSAHSRNHYCYYSLPLSRALSSSLIGGEEACVGVCVRVIVVAYYGLWRNQWWASYKMRIAQLCDSYFRRRRRRRVVGQHHQHNNNNNDNNNKMGRCAPAYIYMRMRISTVHL